jgi:hypothetical protein
MRKAWSLTHLGQPPTMGPFGSAGIPLHREPCPLPEEGEMAETPPYCSDCYNTHARTNDAQVKAAEGAGKTPMTKQGTCIKCGKATIVVYYEA